MTHRLPILLLLAACAAEDASIPCEPRTPGDTDLDVADFYACVDANLADGAGCGPTGYPLGFGGYYGQRYVEGAAENLSADGQAWAFRVASCLQVALIDAIDRDTSCDDVWTQGFGTHDECYVDTGFCELALSDQLWVFSMISVEDRERPEVVAMIQSVLATCGSRAGG